jgi:hypothetical protein
MGNPQQGNQQPKQPDFGEMPDLEDLLRLAEIDGTDVTQAVSWLEDKAPKIADKVAKE